MIIKMAGQLVLYNLWFTIEMAELGSYLKNVSSN
jgi:hypothetical protein